MFKINPLTATIEDIKEEINKLCKRYPIAASSSYAHVVLDDMNLDNDAIVSCLYGPNFDWDSGKGEWAFDYTKTWRERWFMETMDESETWELDQVRKMTTEIDEFLLWLLKVPKETRLQ